MATMLNVYDLNRKKTAVLQNAFDVTETHQLNQIYTLSFSLPAEDPKAQYCLPRHYVRYGDKGELYRIIKPTYSEDNVSVIKYDCEHVITTLCDNVMFGSFTYGGAGVRTVAVITWLLNQQKTKNWKLGVCEFDRKFEYGWEQENLLNALYSIPKEFAQPYQWTFDTTSYPWTVNLKKLDVTAKPQYYLRAKRNILSSGNAQDYSEICTRIYPLGYGEGVNQLGITEAKVNAQGEADENGTRWGKTYIESPQSIIDQYGIIEKVLVDRRFENANSLYAYAKTMLEAYQTPGMSRSFDVTDLYQLTNDAIDKAEVGYITKLTGDGTITYITKTVRNWDIAGDLQIDLSTKATDIASSIADLADRVRIESVYAQGATQLYQHSKDANAVNAKGKGMVLNLYFPSEMKQINKVLLRLRLKKFRSYSTIATAYAGGLDKAQNVVQEGGAITLNDNVKTNPGGAITEKDNISTKEGGAINTSTSSDGGQSGTTGVANGGGGITLTPTVTVEVQGTENANWTPYLLANGNSSNLEVSGTAVDGETSEMGDHTHNLWAWTGDVTPPASDNYKHSHAINYTEGAQEAGQHKHSFTSNWHAHTFSVYKLKHNHPVKASAKVTINNAAKSGSFAHSHPFSFPAHSHRLTIGGHSHPIVLNGHSHTITLKPHTHDIVPGIFESGNPKGFYVYVGSKKLTNISTVVNGKTIKSDANGLLLSTTFDGDITEWLLNDRNQIPRDTWIDVEIVPDDLAYVVSSVFVQGFVQSRGGGNY